MPYESIDPVFTCPHPSERIPHIAYCRMQQTTKSYFFDIFLQQASSEPCFVTTPPPQRGNFTLQSYRDKQQKQK